MTDKDYKAFIVEGENREPQIIDNIIKIFFSHSNYTIITLPAGENIYMLWKQLKEDDFDTDVIEVLRESNAEIRNQIKGLSRDDFSEVFLFFDYDAHHDNLGEKVNEDVIRKMLENFDNETEHGKLYISYPMVEALRDYEPGKCGNAEDCFVEIEDLSNYKNSSAARADNPQFRKYDIEAWKNIIDVFAMKVSCLFEIPNTMEYVQYLDNVTPKNIYTAELKDAENKRVFVLSAFPEFLIDYFGLKLWKTCVKHTRNHKDRIECENQYDTNNK